MKKIWDFVRNFIIFAYILLIIFITICLLSYNNYKVTVFGRNTLLPIIDADLEPDYVVGDLLIIQRNNLSTVKEGDVIFFYRTVAGVTTVNFAKVTEAYRVNDTEVTYTVEGDYTFSSSYFIGKADTATVIPKVGNVISLLESKWGFLFLGVFPSLLAFLYTIHSVITEVQNADDDDDEEEKKAKKKSKKKKKENTNTEEIKELKTEEKTEEPKVEEKESHKEEKIEETKKEENVKIEEEKVEEKTVEKTENKEEKTTEEKIEENKTEETKVEEIKEIKENEETKEENKEEKPKTLTEEQKKALIEAKMKSMTEEQKKALIEAKLKNMTEEQKRALIEAKRKKMEADKNNK